MSILDTIIGVLENTKASLDEAEGSASAVDENVDDLQAAMEEAGMEHLIEKAASLKEPAEFLAHNIAVTKQLAEDLMAMAIEMKQG